jgi:uncharacterized damage-inducible protein DinB
MTSTSVRSEAKPEARPETKAAVRPETPSVQRDYVEPVVVLLEQLGEVVSSLTDAQYAQRPVGVIDSSVGGHVRHCLDHVRSLVTAAEVGSLSYDFRHRGTAVETDRAAAMEAVSELVRSLRRMTVDVLHRPLALSVLMTAEGPAVETRSSVGRELAYVQAHTIHHNALIGAMAKTLGAPLPARFGFAPETVRHMETQRETQAGA